jgi:hypothetical protein
VVGDERCVRRRIRDIRRRRASFFLDLGEQPGLTRGGRALLLRMIVFSPGTPGEMDIAPVRLAA